MVVTEGEGARARYVVGGAAGRLPVGERERERDWEVGGNVAHT